MNTHKKEEEKKENSLGECVGRKEDLKIRGKSNSGKNEWSGLSLFGIIGWFVMVPTVAGALLGVWLDRNHPGKHSWTLALLVAGLVLGCYWAWHWISKEEKAIKKSNQKKDE